MASNPGKSIRLVKCPRCHKVLPENSHVPLYRCGGCGTTLRASNRHDNGENLHLNVDETHKPLNNSSENASPATSLIFSTEAYNTLSSSNAHLSEPSEDKFELTPLTNNSSTETNFDPPKNPKEETLNSEEERDEMQNPPSVLSEEDAMGRCSYASDDSISSDEGKRNIPYPCVPAPLQPSHFACVHSTDRLLRPSPCKLCAPSSFPSNPISIDQEPVKSSSKPFNNCIFDGTPYVICSSCFKLLHIPSTIVTSKQRRFKLQCGNCSVVLEVSLPSKNYTERDEVQTTLLQTAEPYNTLSLSNAHLLELSEDEFKLTPTNKSHTEKNFETSKNQTEGTPSGEEERDEMQNSTSLSRDHIGIKSSPTRTLTLIDGTLIYGREHDVRKIIELIRSDNCKDRNVTVTCMVAASGVGKTTVAQLVYNDKIVCDAFENRIFISTSKSYDEKRIIKEIIEALTLVSCDITEPYKLEEIAKDELKGKKLFLIMDDANNRSRIFWDKIVGLLNNGAKGSALMVTTESITLIDAIGADHSYYLNHLTDEYCRTLFQARAFYGYTPVPCLKLETIGEFLVFSCKRIPLCIKMLADLLHKSVTEKWWNTVSESLIDEPEGEPEGDLWPVLSLCCHYLPQNLKPCFMYCSLFPNNYVFSRHHLVRLWLSEGFVEPVEGKELEKVGIQYFDDLRERSFFEHAQTYDSKDDKFVMPRKIHDFAEMVSREEHYFKSEGCLRKASENIHHLSLVPYEFQTISLDGLIKETRDLQTMLLVSGSRFMSEGTFTPVVSIAGLNDLFMKFRGLKTLDLSSSDVEELPNSIAFLEWLRYLGLNNTNIKNIPKCISKLAALETLEAKNCPYLTELPETLKELAALRHLDVTNESGYVTMPHGIGQLTNLVSLATFTVGFDPVHSKIEELNSLEHLQGSLQISGIENITCDADAKEANLQGKPYLESLSLQWGSTTTYPEEEQDADIAEKILENLKPSNDLQELIIRNYCGNRFPIWFEDPAFSKLVSIILDNCYSCTMLPALGRLPSLRYLSIQKMYDVHTMIDASSVGKENIGMYPSLELLSLSEMYGLEEWPEKRNRDFVQLRTLSINKCPFLRSIPHLPTLLELSLSYGNQLPEISDLPLLESLKIEGFPKIKSINMSCSRPALEKLEIRQCRELSFVACLSRFPSTTKFKIVGCPKLDLANFASPPSKGKMIMPDN